MVDFIKQIIIIIGIFRECSLCLSRSS